MSDQDVAVTQRLYKAFIEGDLAAAAGLVDPEIELQPPPTSPEAGTYKGYGAVRHHLEELTAPFDDVRLELQDFIDTGSGQVVATIHVTGRGKSSGFPIDTWFAHVVTIRKERVVRLQAFLETDQALRAAGLDAGEHSRSDRSKSSPRTIPTE